MQLIPISIIISARAIVPKCFCYFRNQQRNVSLCEEIYLVDIHAPQMFARASVCAIHRLREHESESPLSTFR